MGLYFHCVVSREQIRASFLPRCLRAETRTGQLSGAVSSCLFVYRRSPATFLTNHAEAVVPWHMTLITVPSKASKLSTVTVFIFFVSEREWRNCNIAERISIPFNAPHLEGGCHY